MQKFFPNAIVIKNGVDLSIFLPSSKIEASMKIGFNIKNKNIIFIAQDPTSKVKNLNLAYESIKIINDENIKLHIISNKSFLELPTYYNAADLLLLTSLSEGSPNVIKEAMACNLPIVSTNIGDVKELFGNTEGYYISSFDPDDVALNIQRALDFGKRTQGRDQIKHLDNMIIAEKIYNLYQQTINEQD